MANKKWNVRENTSYDTLNIYSNAEIKMWMYKNYKKDPPKNKEVIYYILFILSDQLNSILDREPWNDKKSDILNCFMNKVLSKRYNEIDFDRLLSINENNNSYAEFLIKSMQDLLSENYKNLDFKRIFTIIEIERNESAIYTYKGYIVKMLKKLIAYESGICKDLEGYDLKVKYWANYPLYNTRQHLGYFNKDWYPIISFAFDELYDKAESYVEKRFANYNIKIPKEKRYTFDDILNMNTKMSFYIRDIIYRYKAGIIKPAEKIK